MLLEPPPPPLLAVPGKPHLTTETSFSPPHTPNLLLQAHPMALTENWGPSVLPHTLPCSCFPLALPLDIQATAASLSPSVQPANPTAGLGTELAGSVRVGAAGEMR